MAIVRIESPADPRIAAYRDLKSPAAKRRSSLFVVEGLLLVRRLLNSGLRVASVLTEERFAADLLPQTPPDAPLYVIPDLSLAEDPGERHGHAFVSGLAGFKFHRGVLACGYRPANADLERLIAAAGATAIFSVCVGIGDPENLGGMIRSSAAFGATAMLVGPQCADPFSRRVARTSMGSNLRLPIVESADLECVLNRLRQRHGVRMVATVLDATAEPLAGFPWPPRVALLFGSEGFGLERRWIDLSDSRITIPMAAGVDSLNVGVAAGIFLCQARIELSRPASHGEIAAPPPRGSVS